MLTRNASHFARLASDRKKPLVYIDFLEVAPWNWNIPDLGQSGVFRRIGTLLLWRAVEQSIEEGFKGRVGLHALPQAARFYEGYGLTSLGNDAAKQNLMYYELSAGQAEKLINGED